MYQLLFLRLCQCRNQRALLVRRRERGTDRHAVGFPRLGIGHGDGKRSVGKQHNEPTEVLARIEAVTSYELWDHFQRSQKASRASTRAHMLSLLLRELLK